MVKNCCVPSCHNNVARNPELKFYMLPSEATEPERRELWLRKIRRLDPSDPTAPWRPKSDYHYVCSQHFITGAKVNNQIHPDYAPSVFPDPSTKPCSLKRKANDVAKKRQQKGKGPKTKKDQPLSAVPKCGTPKLRRRKRRVPVPSEGEMSLDHQHPDFVPSVFENDIKKKQPSRKKEKPSRKISLKERRDEAQPDSSGIAFSAGEGIEIEWPNSADLRVRHIQLQVGYTDLQAKVDSLLAENERLREDLHRVLPRFSYASLKGDDAQLMFLSGLHSLVFDWLVMQIAAKINRVHPELNANDHLLMVLMKLKLGLCDADLGYRFRLQSSSVTSICQTWIPALAFVLKPLIAWPNAKTVAKHRPSIFKSKFSKCRGIVDCPEFVVAKTGETAQENAAVRYFASVTPAGTVSFLSSGYSGDVTKQEITRDSGFLCLVDKRDEFLSCKPIHVNDELASLGATLHTPDYVNGKVNPKSDLDKKLWTHAKKVIGWWKDFNMLKKVVPEAYGSVLDDALIVCAALTNVNLSVNFPKANDK